MSEPSNRWTTQDLELFHDEEMEEPRRSQLSEDLRRDPQLRERYATVRRVDDLMRAGITEGKSAERRRWEWRIPLRMPAAAAAGLLITVTAVWWFASVHKPVGDVSVVDLHVPDEPESPAEGEYRAVRVVFSLPLRTDSRSLDGEREVGSDAERGHRVVAVAMREDTDFLLRLNRAIGAGRIEETLDLLERSSDEQRAAAYRYIGDLLRSASVAEQILDRLSPPEQVAACGQWAREPVVRSVAFNRLRSLSKREELAGEVKLVLDKLAQDPTLSSWLRSYRLHESRGLRNEVAG